MDENQENKSGEVVPIVKVYDIKSRFMEPTLFSKGLSLVLFVIIPLVSLFVGYNYGHGNGFGEGEKVVLKIEEKQDEVWKHDFNTKTTRSVLGEFDEERVSQIESVILDPDSLRHLGHLYFTDELNVYFLYEKVGDKSVYILLDDADTETFVSLGGGDGISNGSRYFYGIKNETATLGKSEHRQDADMSEVYLEAFMCDNFAGEFCSTSIEIDGNELNCFLATYESGMTIEYQTKEDLLQYCRE